MFCYKHPKRLSIGGCKRCGVLLCADCVRLCKGIYYCDNCTPKGMGGGAQKRSPIFAALLSALFPGVGQVYNGQVGKGILIFFFCWLIAPWLYGIVDAFSVAKRIRAGKQEGPTAAGYWVGCMVVTLMFLLSPFILTRSLKYYLMLSRINIEDTLAIRNLMTISQAAEKYAEDQGDYPASFSELYFADPPYIHEVCCDVTIGGNVYQCIFSQRGYTLTATPVKDDALRNLAFTITTGGALTPKKLNRPVKKNALLFLP